MRLSYLDKNILLRLAILIFVDILLFGFAFSGANYYLVQHYPLIQIGTMVVFTLFAALTVSELGKFVRGFEGEDDIRRILSKLPNKYYRFYDLNLINKGNIDAIVVGPTGVWSIEVKSHSGKITFENDQLHINGHYSEKDFLAQAYAESAALREYLSKKLGQDIHIHPILVFANRKAQMKFGLRQLKGVYVIGGAWLTKLICEQTETLNPYQIKQIVSVINIVANKH